MVRATEQMSLAEARRLALAAQGFARPRPAGRVEARQLPLRLHPLLRWRMQAAERQVWGGDLRRRRRWLEPGMNLAPWAVISGMNRIAAERPELVDEVQALVTERGPVAAASALPAGHPHGDGSDIGTGTMWNWHNAKIVLE